MVVADVCLQILLNRAFLMLCASAVLETAAVLSNQNINKSEMKCKDLICYISSKSVSIHQGVHVQKGKYGLGKFYPGKKGPIENWLGENQDSSKAHACGQQSNKETLGAE